MACRIGSVGQFVPGMEHELEPVPGIESGGILHVKGPNVMKGYLLYDNPGVIVPPNSIRLGWHNTGDIVVIDEDGFVHIRGRVKRFAKIAGEMISLEVVEQIAAKAAPGFAHAASTRPDPAKGEAIVLFTTAPAIGRDQLSTAAKALGAPELGGPAECLTLDEIPLLGTGKTDYVRLKTMAENPPMPQRRGRIMNSDAHPSPRSQPHGAALWSRAMVAVLAAQFLSATGRQRLAVLARWRC